MFLPDYYKTDHPKLISFLETYYNTLDSDHSFSTAGKNKFILRDKKEADSAGTGQVTYGWDSDRNFGYQLANIPTLRDIVQTDTEESQFLLKMNFFWVKVIPLLVVRLINVLVLNCPITFIDQKVQSLV